MQLYKIDSQLLSVIHQADPVTGEINAELLDNLQMERAEKMENIVLFVRDSEHYLDAVDEEIKRLKESKARAEGKVTWLKNYLLNSMLEWGQNEFKFGVHQAKIRNNPVSVSILDQDLIPEKFKKQVIDTKIDKTAIKEAIQAGEEVTGAELQQNKRIDLK